MFDCEAVQQAIARSPLVRSCDVVGGESLRLMTPFSYPNGSNIDVFVVPAGQAEREAIVTDFGQTVSWLSDLNLDPSASRNRRRMAESICERLGLKFDGWQIASTPVGLDAVPEYLYKVAQASIRLADLVFTRRRQFASPLRDDVEEFIADINANYESNVSIRGVRGTPVPVDFRVQGPRRDSLILLLPRYTHQAANEIFIRWYELRDRDEQRLTVFDGAGDGQIRADDLERLEELSLVLPWQNREQLRDLVIA